MLNNLLNYTITPSIIPSELLQYLLLLLYYYYYYYSNYNNTNVIAIITIDGTVLY